MDRVQALRKTHPFHQGIVPRVSYLRRRGYYKNLAEQGIARSIPELFEERSFDLISYP